MNQRLEISIETTNNNSLYRLTLPGVGSFESAYQVLDAFKVQLQMMQQNQEAQESAQQQATQEQGAQ